MRLRFWQCWKAIKLTSDKVTIEKQGFCFHSEDVTIFMAPLWSYEMNFFFLHKDVQGVEIVSGILCVGRVGLFLPECCPMSLAYLLGGPSKVLQRRSTGVCLSQGPVSRPALVKQSCLTACSTWKEAALSERANGEKHSVSEHLSAPYMQQKKKEQSNWTWGVLLQLQLLLEIKAKQKGCFCNM